MSDKGTKAEEKLAEWNLTLSMKQKSRMSPKKILPIKGIEIYATFKQLIIHQASK